MSWFGKKDTSNESDIIKYSKNPELLPQPEQMTSEDNERYKQHKKKLKDL